MYITVQDLEQVFSTNTLIQLTNDASRATEVDAVIATKAIEYSCEIVDGYLRSRYVVPLQFAPTIVTNITLQIARYWLYSRRPENRGFPDIVKDSYNRALKDLQAIQCGKLHLGIIDTEVPDNSVAPDSPVFQVRASANIDLGGY